MAKIKKLNFKSKKTWKNILIIGLAIITLIGAIVGISALFRKSEEKTTKEINPTYAIGGLTEQGSYLETKESIYTKDAFECYGLKTSLDFDNNISYRLFFYDEESKFIESSSKLTNSYDSSKTNMPEDTKYCRVVITPNEDSKISWYEKSGYAKQLTIKVNKDQTKSDGVFVPVNVLVLPSTLVGKEFKSSLSEYENATALRCSEVISVSGYSKMILRVSPIDNNTRVRFSESLEGAVTLFALANGSMPSATLTTDKYVQYEFDIISGYIYCGITVSTGGVEDFAPIVYLS